MEIESYKLYLSVLLILHFCCPLCFMISFILLNLFSLSLIYSFLVSFRQLHIIHVFIHWIFFNNHLTSFITVLTRVKGYYFIWNKFLWSRQIIGKLGGRDLPILSDLPLGSAVGSSCWFCCWSYYWSCC